MDNPTMARLLAETADLLEIDGGDGFRIRSYRRAAEAAEQTTVDLVAAAADTARLLEIPGIGKGMAANLQAIAATGTLPLRDELLAKYGASLLELLKLPGMGPKTVALLWSAAQIASIDPLAEAIEAGRLSGLPRMGEKQIEKLRKGIEDYRRSVGRFRIDVAEEEAQRISAYLSAFDGIERVTPAGSLRRGRETAATSICSSPDPPARRSTPLPPLTMWLLTPASRASSPRATTRSASIFPTPCRSMCACCRRASYGAALQYFTGSKAHNVALRQRALKMGYTLSEWALARLGRRVRGGRRH